MRGGTGMDLSAGYASSVGPVALFRVPPYKSFEGPAGTPSQSTPSKSSELERPANGPRNEKILPRSANSNRPSMRQVSRLQKTDACQIIHFGQDTLQILTV